MKKWLTALDVKPDGLAGLLSGGLWRIILALRACFIAIKKGAGYARHHWLKHRNNIKIFPPPWRGVCTANYLFHQEKAHRLPRRALSIWRSWCEGGCKGACIFSGCAWGSNTLQQLRVVVKLVFCRGVGGHSEVFVGPSP